MSYTPFVTDFDYEHKWTNPDDFPTYEAEEAKVRADMQLLYTEIADGLNQLIAAMKTSSTAGYLGVTGSGQFSSATNVQAALQALSNAISSLVAQTVPANSIETFMIKDSQVTTAKIANGAVDTPQLADDAVTAAKIGDGAVGTAALASGAVTPAKVDFTAADLTLGADGSGVQTGLHGLLILGSDNYGENDPSTNLITGRVFFKKA